MSDDESIKEIAGQFGLYTISSIVATIVNFGLQAILTFVLGKHPLKVPLLIIIALTVGYTTKYLMDSFITFKKQRKEDSKRIIQYTIYMLLAVGYFFLQVYLQMFFLITLNQFIVAVYNSLLPIVVQIFGSGMSFYFYELLRFFITAGISVIIVWVLKFPVDKYVVFKYF